MRILFCTGGMALPEMLGGSQRTAETLIRALTRRGHAVALTAALSGKGRVGKVARLKIKLSGKGYAVDRSRGYPVYRSWFPDRTLDAVVGHFRPDACVVLAHRQAAMAAGARRLSVPIVLALQDVEFRDDMDVLRGLGPVPSVANSRFTADSYRRALGLDPAVIYPLIDIANYLTEPDGDAVLFINPSPQKGVDVAIGVARAMPEQTFVFLEAWPLDDARRRLVAAIADVPNIVLKRPSDDMRPHYRNARLLLAPSQWEEGYGRIATEAQASGIPVVGSSRGGLPEAIGAGGEILPHDAPIAEWVAAIRKILSPDHYRSYCERAKAHARRDTLRVDRQVGEWERSIALAAGQAE